MNNWRFPRANHTDKRGISTADTETFKKNAHKGFAREILQNSIDARASDESPVLVEFKTFEIDTAKIPGIDELRQAAQNCIDLWSYKKDYVAVYDKILKSLSSKKITCLRVSDYNTTGLVGIESSESENNRFLALAKSTGVSEKPSELAGGSKGVGKNAAFLMSSTKVVFYSTKTNQGLNGELCSYSGSIGVADFASGVVVGSQNNDYTLGKGYYCSNDLHEPCDNLLMLDESALNRNDECGTDIFIIGYSDSADTKKEVVNSVLESFMASIFYGHIVVKYQDIIISKETLDSLVFDEELIDAKLKNEIVSQYLILKGGEDVSVFDIDTEYGNCSLYILKLGKDNSDLATHQITMIRKPYMKIKNFNMSNSYDASALCIIEGEDLGKALRNIENPKHDDWETNRIEDKAYKKEIVGLINEIKIKINEKIIECLQLDNDDPIDPNGAGEYLPDEAAGDSGQKNNEKPKPADEVTMSKRKENSTSAKNANYKSDFDNGLEPQIGGIDDEGNEVEYPGGRNEKTGGDPHPGTEKGGKKDGDSVIFVRAKLAGVNYKFIGVNPKEGRFNVVFNAPTSIEECYLSLLRLDDVNGGEQIEIIEMKVNGINVDCSTQIEAGPFSIKEGQKVLIQLVTNIHENFGSEVKITYASQK